MARLLPILLVLLSLALPAAAQEKVWIPELGEEGREDFEDYKRGREPKAFAVDPDGIYGKQVGGGSLADAAERALAKCAEKSRFPEYCTLLAANNQYVFRPRNWPKGAGKPKPDDTARVPEGTERGTLFPNLAFTTPGGRERAIRDLRGRVVVVHFWGSWNASSRRDLSGLSRLSNALSRQRDSIAFVLLQVREDIKTSRAWAKRAGLRLPLSDSGATKKRSIVRYTDGAEVPTDHVADTVPMSFIVDKTGRITQVFRRPVNWNSLRRTLEDLAKE